eukprot:TRINITY_DN653_c0_g1_i1.p1 TRINITY_DN653_c0_g1~~TRINITY_DN653_c0_g1_i1.p1  ORF type:complete len:205 (-),score=39.66 TRINITY_DN653_c0_g1_i1:189-803(-)
MFVVDASCPKRFPEAFEELSQIVIHPQVLTKPILILGNKQDLDSAEGFLGMADGFELGGDVMRRVPCSLHLTSATTSDGIDHGLAWLVSAIIRRRQMKNNPLPLIEMRDTHPAITEPTPIQLILKKLCLIDPFSWKTPSSPSPSTPTSSATEERKPLLLITRRDDHDEDIDVNEESPSMGSSTPKNIRLKRYHQDELGGESRIL